MAYSTYLASISEEQVQRLRTEPDGRLRPSCLVSVSHLIAYWVQIQPLGHLLGEAIDGGFKLSDRLWHPLLQPTYHPPEHVRRILSSLSEACEQATSVPILTHDWFGIEIGKVLKVFGDAAAHGYCVVKMLQPPADAERASRVHIPLEVAPENPTVA